LFAAALAVEDNIDTYAASYVIVEKKTFQKYGTKINQSNHMLLLLKPIRVLHLKSLLHDYYK